MPKRARNAAVVPKSVGLRRSRILRAWLIAGACCATLPGFADTVQYQGRATDPATGRFLYSETHLLQSDGGRMQGRVVLYRCANGDAFARKRVDYSQSQIAPDFELVDARDGYREGLRREDGRIVAFVQAGLHASESRAVINASPALVADAGFDAFVASQWTALAAGKALALDFVIPARGKAYGFKVARSGTTTIGGVPAIAFRLQLRGVLALLVSSIDVSYAAGSHRLLRFEGVTNIRSSNGGQMTARIDFPATAPKQVAAKALQDAMALPLKACTVAR